MSLTRFWFEFHITEYTPQVASDPGELDADESQDRSLAGGVGVTAFDEQDALGLVRDFTGTQLPAIVERLTDLAADRRALRASADAPIGNAAWRGVWFPAPARPHAED